MIILNIPDEPVFEKMGDRMRKSAVILACIILMLLPAGLSAAQAPELGKWWKNSEVVEALHLYGDQIEQIEKSYLGHREELADLVGTLKAYEQRLESAMNVEPLDEAVILDRVESVAEARKRLEIARAKMLISIRKLLTTDQWNVLNVMRKLSGVPILPVSESADVSAGAGPDRVYDSNDKGIKTPMLLSKVNPTYTDEARAAKVEGIVVLEAIIHKDGSVGNFKVLRGLGYGLDESAISTVRKKWKFSPGMLDGKPLDYRVTIEVTFRRY